LISELYELLHKLGIKLSHSLLGISILAIADNIVAIYLLTKFFGDAKVAKIASFI
jgi:hypothetical protein